MSDQESAKSEQRTKAIIAGVFLAIAAVVLWYRYAPSPQPVPSKAYFSEDDGASWYPESADTLPPFTHAGFEAVRAFVYRTEKNPEPFAAYLAKFPPEAKEAIEKQANQKTPPTPTREIAYVGDFGKRMLVKTPRKGACVAADSAEGAALIAVKSPDGTPLEQLFPGD